MIRVDANGIITVTRGDTFKIPLFINQGTELAPVRYVLTGTDHVDLFIMEANDSFTSPLLKKIYTSENLNDNNDVLIRFLSEDTAFMKPGKYFYEIKAYVTREGEAQVNTIIPRTKFIVLE